MWCDHDVHWSCGKSAIAEVCLRQSLCARHLTQSLWCFHDTSIDFLLMPCLWQSSLPWLPGAFELLIASTLLEFSSKPCKAYLHIDNKEVCHFGSSMNIICCWWVIIYLVKNLIQLTCDPESFVNSMCWALRVPRSKAYTEQSLQVIGKLPIIMVSAWQLLQDLSKPITSICYINTHRRKSSEQNSPA